MTRRKKKSTKKRSKRKSVCVTGGETEFLGSYAEIVRHYKKTFQKGADRIQLFYSKLRSIDEAIEKAAFARLPSGKRHPHQYRLKHRDLQRVHQRLKLYDIESCETFHELFETVHEAITGISGIGELMVYDTAHRLGSYLGLEPEYVYIHAGVRKGSKALGFKGSVKWIDPSTLPRAFKKLTPGEIEDCLCIYKDELTDIAND